MGYYGLFGLDKNMFGVADMLVTIGLLSLSASLFFFIFTIFYLIKTNKKIKIGVVDLIQKERIRAVYYSKSVPRVKETLRLHNVDTYHIDDVIHLVMSPTKFNRSCDVIVFCTRIEGGVRVE